MQESDEENTDDGRQSAIAAGIGKKMYYSISEVCAMTGVEPHILRYWEKEFSLLRPKKNSGGKRAYKEKDIEIIIKIKRLLEEENYTLQGAKSKLLDERRERRTGVSATAAKRRKTDTAEAENEDGSGDSDGTDSTDSSAPISIPTTDAAPKLTKRKITPNKNKNHGVNNVDNNIDDINDDVDKDNHGNDNDNALILSIREELLEVLKLLE